MKKEEFKIRSTDMVFESEKNEFGICYIGGTLEKKFQNIDDN